MQVWILGDFGLSRWIILYNIHCNHVNAKSDTNPEKFVENRRSLTSGLRHLLLGKRYQWSSSVEIGKSDWLICGPSKALLYVKNS